MRITAWHVLGLVALAMAAASDSGEAAKAEPEPPKENFNLGYFKQMESALQALRDDLSGYLVALGLLYKVLVNAFPQRKPELQEIVNSSQDALTKGGMLWAWMEDNAGSLWTQGPVAVAKQILKEVKQEEEEGIDGGGPPEETLDCEVRKYPHDAQDANLDVEKPSDYGVDMMIWNQWRAVWNKIIVDQYCWHMTDAISKQLESIPGPALWDNLGAPPPHVLAAAAELYYARLLKWPTDWNQVLAEISFVQKHLL